MDKRKNICVYGVKIDVMPGPRGPIKSGKFYKGNPQQNHQAMLKSRDRLAWFMDTAKIDEMVMGRVLETDDCAFVDLVSDLGRGHFPRLSKESQEELLDYRQLEVFEDALLKEYSGRIIILIEHQRVNSLSNRKMEAISQAVNFLANGRLAYYSPDLLGRQAFLFETDAADIIECYYERLYSIIFRYQMDYWMKGNSWYPGHGANEARLDYLELSMNAVAKAVWQEFHIDWLDEEKLRDMSMHAQSRASREARGVK